MLEVHFRELLEAAPDAMVIVDGTGTIVLVNGQTERLFGYDRAELVGQKVELLVPVRFQGRHAGHRARYFADSHVREMGSGLELFAVRRDGSEFPVEISLSPLHTQGGTLVTSAIRDITERLKSREKDVRIREIHHRVKNNLQVVSSLLKLHAEQVTAPGAREAFEDAQARVRSIALLHDALSDPTTVGDFDGYVRALVATIGRGMGIVWELDLSGVSLSLDQALPCALILNELVTNAVKYGWVDAEAWIAVSTRRVGDEVVLEVADRGPGFPPHPREGSLGLHLVRTLVRQLRGTVTFSQGPGARVTVRFPAQPVGGR